MRPGNQLPLMRDRVWKSRSAWMPTHSGCPGAGAEMVNARRFVFLLQRREWIHALEQPQRQAQGRLRLQPLGRRRQQETARRGTLFRDEILTVISLAPGGKGPQGPIVPERGRGIGRRRGGADRRLLGDGFARGKQRDQQNCSRKFHGSISANLVRPVKWATSPRPNRITPPASAPRPRFVRRRESSR